MAVKASRFLTEETIALLDVQELAAAPLPAAVVTASARVEIPTLEHLFT